ARPARWASGNARPWGTLTATAGVTRWARSIAASTIGTWPTGHSALGRMRVRGRSRAPAPAASTTAARLSSMETRRWVNPSQPQTLQIAVFLLYFNAVFTAIFGGLFSVFGLLIIAGCAAAGFGIANEQKWGYGVGVAMARMNSWRSVKRSRRVAPGPRIASRSRPALRAVLPSRSFATDPSGPGIWPCISFDTAR